MPPIVEVEIYRFAQSRQQRLITRVKGLAGSHPGKASLMPKSSWEDEGNREGRR